MAPEPKKQAARGQKQIHKENQDTVVFYTVIAAVTSVVYVGVNRLVYWDSFTFKFQFLFCLTSVLYFLALGLMKRMSKARFSADGSLIEAGTDLNMQNGMAEHLKDVILLLAIVETVGLFWNYVWLALLLLSKQSKVIKNYGLGRQSADIPPMFPESGFSFEKWLRTDDSGFL